MDFYQGGLFAYDRDEGCFIKYMADAIQSAQLHLKNEQWDINGDFEEFISSIRRFGKPLCIWNWHILLLRLTFRFFALHFPCACFLLGC